MSEERIVKRGAGQDWTLMQQADVSERQGAHDMCDGEASVQVRF